jgi:uncharacterized protein DUF3800
VRLIYLDEAGISNPAQEPLLVVAGVAVNADRQFKQVEAYLDELIEKHVPKEKRDGCVFHAMDIFHGTKRFDRKSWSFEKRLEILDDLAAIPKKFDLPICYGLTDRPSIPGLLMGPASPSLIEIIAHGHAFFKFLMQMEVVLRATAQDEVGMLIAEDRDRVRKALKVAHAGFRGRALKEFQADWEKLKEGLFKLLLPLERIVETVHFAQKGESSLLQVADICAFAIKRHCMQASHSDRLYNPMRDQLVFTPEVVAALSSTVRAS